MEINWDWSTDTYYRREFLPADTLDRGKYAQYLYQVCAARGEKSNLVININAEWGAGKTYFTKRLADTISAQHPTVYIDSWKEDYSEDPLLTVFSAIKEQLTGQSDKFTTLINKTVENIGPLLKTATPLILDGLIKKITGIEDFTDLTKDLSTKLIELHTEKSSKIETVKKGIGEWVRFINQKDGIENKKLPLFIIIDELDRCRPDFAINLLEITKHIFNIPGVVFIIATDTEQLQHSIKVIYGSDFSANHYLGRFFDRRFLLPAPQMRSFLYTITPLSVIEDFDQLQNKISPTPPSFEVYIDNIASILESMSMNLRDAIKLYERITDVLITINKNLDLTLFLILSILNIKNNELYSIYKSKRLTKESLNLSDAKINVFYDLSRERTGVVALIKNGARYTNTYKLKEISTSLSAYIEHASSVIDISSPISMAGRFHEEWWDGGLNDDGTLPTFLKMGWAKNKSFDCSLTLDQYYELIELSTTFES